MLDLCNSLTLLTLSEFHLNLERFGLGGPLLFTVFVLDMETLLQGLLLTFCVFNDLSFDKSIYWAVGSGHSKEQKLSGWRRN